MPFNIGSLVRSCRTVKRFAGRSQNAKLGFGTSPPSTPSLERSLPRPSLPPVLALEVPESHPQRGARLLDLLLPRQENGPPPPLECVAAKPHVPTFFKGGGSIAYNMLVYGAHRFAEMQDT